jgi:prepilin-type N-terminal cleavage/methylation domain-containing protein
MTQAFNNKQSGFSLIEVVIALAIFSIGILAVAQMELLTSKTNRSAHHITQALLLVESHLERLRNVPDVALLDALDGNRNTNLDAFGNPGGIYTRTTRITNPLGGDFSRRIEVSVEWTRLGRNRRVSLASLTQGNGL